MKALVEATPISGPACVSSEPAASRTSIEPCTLQIAIGSAPRALASRKAPSVSAVSPLWLIATASVVWADERLPVAELAAVVDLDRDLRELLDQELADERRVPAGAAGEQHRAVGPAQPLGRGARAPRGGPRPPPG